MSEYLNSCMYWASNVTEAVDFVKKLKANRRYDLFRGQIRNFPIQPSIFRSGIDQRAATASLNDFATWIHSVPELASLHGNTDLILATAQHYGLRTPLLDFTTNPSVAGFFAADGDPPKMDTEYLSQSCIICASRNVLSESWRDLNLRSQEQGNGPLVRLVEVHVPNLWRLQSQEGLFLDVRVNPTLLEMYSYFFRVLFPYTGAFSKPRRTTIYPSRKSHLEGLLEEYFFSTKYSASMQELEEQGFHSICSSQNAFLGVPSAFKSGTLPLRLPSWNTKEIAGWRVEPDERFKDVLSAEKMRVRIPEAFFSRSIYRLIKGGILRKLRRGNSLRARHMAWEIVAANNEQITISGGFQDVDQEAASPKVTCQSRVELLWDGIRRLPYTDEQVAACLSNFISLAIYNQEADQALFGGTQGVEFSTEIARNRASVNDVALAKCIRRDLLALIAPLERARMMKGKRISASNALQILTDPARLFEYMPFADLFVRQIIPTQLWVGLEENMMIFSPARLSVFGNA